MMIPHSVNPSGELMETEEGAVANPFGDTCVRIFGVRIVDTTKARAIDTMRRWIDDFDGRSRAIFIANAHTLNLAWENPGYRRVLNSADVTLADGTGVRLAARLCGVALSDNLVGTDLVPQFIAQWPSYYRFFLLGGVPGKAAAAAEGLWALMPECHIAGHHHGFFGESEDELVIRRINSAEPDVLLVGMGNPHQERWIHRALPRLRVPVCIGVGGLFDYWAGQLRRAPLWMRRLGFEWCHILLHQPVKWRRYLVGNPKFVVRALINARRPQGRTPLLETSA
jgi:N-acetylglucosaminyldiphosphoundecaprenol N-acetyl-beta-D-mannosaminyltransferase